MKKLGVLLEGSRTTNINLELIKFLSSQFEVVLIVKNNPLKSSFRVKDIPYLLVDRLFLRLFDTNKFFEKSKVPTECRIISVTCNYSKSKLYVDIDNNSFDVINTESFNSIIRLDFSGIFRGNLVDLKVISIHHGDNYWNRGGPSGFWEVINKKPSCGYLIQVLSSKLDDGKPLFQGYVKSHFIHVKNRINLFEDSYRVLIMLLNEEEHTHIPRLQRRYYDGSILKLPTIFYVLNYLRLVLYYSMRVAFISETWTSMYLDTGKSTDLRKANKIDSDRELDVIADPFLYEVDGRLYCLVECYSYSHSYGVIDAYVLENGSWKIYRHNILNNVSHLSFPNVNRIDGELFLLPESSNEKNLKIYKLNRSSHEWEFLSTVENDLKVADCVLEKKEGMYIISGTFAWNNSDYTWKQVRYTSSCLQGPWKRDFIFNATRMSWRRGGTVQSSVEAVFQDHGFMSYGESLSIYNETENKIETYTTQNLPDYQGVHHLSALDNHLVFDLKRYKIKRVKWIKKFYS